VAKPVLSYDKDLPEVPDRQPHLPPTSYLRRKPGSADEWEVAEGRRPSKLLLVNRLRQAVGEWRENGYEGASSVTRQLFTYWFEEDHLRDGRLFRYHFGQREAVETLVYLVEVACLADAKKLIEAYGEVFYPEGAQHALIGSGLSFQTAMDGGRQLRRYIPEVQSETVQDLPAENLARYAFKMATGSGKTYVMAMLMVWSYFHRRFEPGSTLSTNFLIIAPNVIVYQRLEKDFASNQIFHELPLIPPGWDWSMKVILRGESAEPAPSGNLFLTNVQQIHESRETDWIPANAIDALLGRKPVKDLAAHEKSMLERIKSLGELAVFNDEAHHVHDEELQWHKTLMSIHSALPHGLSLWLDFSATPKDQNGTYFPWIICDYPLAQAVEDRIVKAPLIVHQVKRNDPDVVSTEDVVEAYSDWLIAAVERWREHYDTYRELGPKLKPVLFIMAEKNDHADVIGRWLVETKELGLKPSEVCVIHTDKEGEITKKELDKAREAVRDIDLPGNRIKVIVSVLMLREGWDVRSVTVVLGLRPFTSKAKILPEQAVGRGLRLIPGVSPDRTQTLEVMGTNAFEDFVRQLEAEGVGIRTAIEPPKPPIRIEPVQEKIAYDINIPLTKPVYTHSYKRLNELDPLSLEPIDAYAELDERTRIRLKMEFATTETEVHQADVAAGVPPPAQTLLASITNKVIAQAKLTGQFAELYPLVRAYVRDRCFGRVVDLDDDNTRNSLRRFDVQEGIARYLAQEIGGLIAEKRSIEFEDAGFRLSDTRPFTWRRNLPPLTCAKTIFNYVATYNDFEKAFAAFMDKCPDIARFASLGTTEQESGTRFKVDYLKPSGAIGFYYPDWVAVQKTTKGEVHWIIETKGRQWADTPYKDAAIGDWCSKVSSQTGVTWRYVRVNQTDFGYGLFSSFAELLEKVQRAKGVLI